MEESNLVGESSLFIAGLLPEPAFETLPLVLREGPLLIDVEHDIHDSFDRFHLDNRIDKWGYRPGDLTHEISICKYPVTEIRHLTGISPSGRMDKVGNLNSGWTGDFTALAVHAVLEILIKEVLVL